MRKNLTRAPILQDIVQKLNSMEDKYDNIFNEQIEINKGLQINVESMRKKIGMLKQDKNEKEHHNLWYIDPESERTVDIVNRIANSLNIELEEIEAFRLGKREPGDVVPIKVIFGRKQDKLNFVKKKKDKITTEGLVYEGTNNKFYFNDELTKYNQELFKITKEFGRGNEYKYVWVKNGKIMH
ncbi:uncharacterized protein [Onthophagus taurus]|uniref:uncharacterized protein n=1 Tax=Onthophagus taurus TaxID=166361 RepID=UPI0039BE58BC